MIPAWLIEKLGAVITGTTTKRVNVIICATQADGTVTPVKCDANGQLMTVAGA